MVRVGDLVLVEITSVVDVMLHRETFQDICCSADVVAVLVRYPHDRQRIVTEVARQQVHQVMMCDYAGLSATGAMFVVTGVEKTAFACRQIDQDRQRLRDIVKVNSERLAVAANDRYWPGHWTFYPGRACGRCRTTVSTPREHAC